MKKSLTVVALIALSSISTIAFAGKKDSNHFTSKQDHQITVGNENSASKGSNSEDKSVRIDKNDSMSNKDHDMNVGNENAASKGNNFEDKTIKGTKAHTIKGKSHSNKK